jgi:hypothetical protein
MNEGLRWTWICIVWMYSRSRLTRYWVCTSWDRKRQKKSPKWQWAVYNENSIFEQMAVPVIQSVSTPAPLILLWLLPEAYHCVARNEFYKTMPCLISPRPPRRDHTSLHSPLPQPLSMHFKAQVRRKVTNFCIKPQPFGFKQKVTTIRQK